MKLLFFLVISLLLSTVTSKLYRRGRLRCGPVVDACLGQLANGMCPRVPFCPGNVKRVLTSAGCCCSAPKVIQSTDPSSELNVEKAKILTATLDLIESTYIQARLDIDALPKSGTDRTLFLMTIDNASVTINKAMVRGMKEVADLYDVEYFDVLPQVFGDEEAEKSERGQDIVKEISAIYEKGESIFTIFQKLTDDSAPK